MNENRINDTAAETNAETALYAVPALPTTSALQAMTTLPLPAETSRIYHAEEPDTSRISHSTRKKDERPIFIRALIFGGLAALAMFTADISRDGNISEVPPAAETDSNEQSRDNTDIPENITEDIPKNLTENSPEASPENIMKNIFTSLSDKMGQAMGVFSLGAARAELWSFTDMLSAAKQKLEGLGGLFENNENISQNSGNTNPVTGGVPNMLTLTGDDSGILSKGVRRMPSSSDEEGDVHDSPLPAASGNASPLPYTSCGDEAGGDILRQSYPAYTGENYINLPIAGQLRNVTALSNNEVLAECSIAPDFSIELNSPLPQVLIMHTHTTETYERSERSFYDSDFLARTTDSDMNMTAVGRAMAKVLNENGINTIHDETVHDYPSYNGSYDRSRETVAKILRENPSIKVVLDVHRDAIERADGTRVAPYVSIDGKNAAQIMIICGCDDGTMDMPDCMKNLRTASLFEQYIESNSPGLTRPVLFDYRKYNQDMTTGSLLIEVGGHANSIDEAVYAGELAAKGIADALIETAG